MNGTSRRNRSSTTSSRCLLLALALEAIHLFFLPLESYGFVLAPVAARPTTSSKRIFGIPAASAASEQYDGQMDNFLVPEMQKWVGIILEGYERNTGEQLIADCDSMSQRDATLAVATAPFCVLAHDFLRSEEDPIYCYGNMAALTTFGYEFSEFVNLPSRLCVASTQERELREQFLSDVKDGRRSMGARGDAGYTGVRVTKDGQLFTVENVTLFNLFDPVERGRIIGQAATFKEAHFL